MARTRVPRPTKRTEYEIEFATRQAEKGWRDLCATMRSAMADAWDGLTRDPLAENRTCHGLKGSLATVADGGLSHDRRQYELPKGARIWFYVEDGHPGIVVITEVHTHHPNQTK
jgi:hypothetical protein